MGVSDLNLFGMSEFRIKNYRLY